MAEDIAKGGEAAKTPAIAQPTSDINKDLKALPMVESPPLSPAGGEPSVTPEPRVEPVASPADDGAALPLPAAARLRFKPRQKRQAILAASVTIAACIGAIIGALATSMSAPPADTQREAMQQSIGKLDKEIVALKAELEAGTKSARGQIAKINDKISERLNRAPEITGSITPPATVPTPTPRPDLRMTVVRDWRIYNVRDGVVAVEGHGEIYEIGIGAPLPGLGPVEQITRQDGRWVVKTPRGMIVSQRDRRYFEPN